MNEIKMPASFAAVEEEEMTYVVGGEVTAWQTFIDFGSMFNYIARVFSSASSIVNNVVTIVNSVNSLNKLFGAFGDTKK